MAAGGASEGGPWGGSSPVPFLTSPSIPCPLPTPGSPSPVPTACRVGEALGPGDQHWSLTLCFYSAPSLSVLTCQTSIDAEPLPCKVPPRNHRKLQHPGSCKAASMVDPMALFVEGSRSLMCDRPLQDVHPRDAGVELQCPGVSLTNIC